MSTSRLVDAIEKFDPFGEDRLNGLKAAYLFLLLCLFYFFYNVKEPYFYYFYVPITAFAAEILGPTLRKKYVFLATTIVGSALSILLFNLLSPYKLLFILFVFFYSASLYFYVINTNRNLLIIVAMVLSLAAYSLLYANESYSLVNAVNHCLNTLAAGFIMLAGLWLLPNKCYLYTWRRAFIVTLSDLDKSAGLILEGQQTKLPLCIGLPRMQRYGNMLSKQTQFFSILKITLLTFDLVMYHAYLLSFRERVREEYVTLYRHYLVHLQNACKICKPIALKKRDLTLLNETHELRVLKNIIQSWNYLCSHKR